MAGGAVRLIAAALLIAAPPSLHAQSAQSIVSLGAQSKRAETSPIAVTIASAILPGAGQALLREKRSAVYIAFEAVGVGFLVAKNREGTRQRDEYRGLARSVARAGYDPDGPTGTWDYYERMEKYVASGAYDRNPGGDIDPETDASTYNGAMWLLARQTYWRDPEVSPALNSPEYTAAISFYRNRAVTPEFEWSWVSSPEAFRNYRSAIAASNSAFRSASQAASFVLANHFLSAIDAYVSVRLRVHRSTDGRTVISMAIPR